MNSKTLYKIVATTLREEYGIDSYSIEGMTLTNRNYFVNEEGKLDSVGYIDVKIKPKCNKDEITISVKRE